MSVSAAAKLYMSYAEYIAFEEKSETKHEWLDGVVYDMSGGTPDHAQLIAAVTIRLGTQLDDRPCTVYSADLQVRVLETEFCAYPDVTVVCGERILDPENQNAVTNPRVIVEVLSESTEKFDRGTKFAYYQRIPSLMEYVLVSQREPCIEVFRKNADGDWLPVEKYTVGQTATLASVECVLPVDRVYGPGLRLGK